MHQEEEEEEEEEEAGTDASGAEDDGRFLDPDVTDEQRRLTGFAGGNHQLVDAPLQVDLHHGSFVAAR